MSDKGEEEEIPENFSKIILDFLNDMETTFPEFKEILQGIRDELGVSNIKLFMYCKEVYPIRFFDILYQNEKIFNDDDETNVHFLPNINFKNLWTNDLTDKTKEIIWKYLQLILFTVIGNIDNSQMFGETSHLFEAIDEESLKTKLEETVKEMSKMFEGTGMDFENMSKDFNNEDLPNPEDLHNHLSGLMDGKLGKLANEIAEETAKELNFDMKNPENMGDIFQKLFQNPGKLISMVKRVGNKIQEKIDSGEIKESELMEEAKELMTKMKGMPGMKNFQDMFSKMGMPKNGKMNMAKMDSNIKLAKQKERMREKLKKRKEAQEKKTFTHSVFKDETTVEKSKRVNNKKKKRKKKKKKKKAVEPESKI